jgi:hypothetical protein
LERRPTKLVKGQGLAKLLAEGNKRVLYINAILENLEKNEWYSDIFYYLNNLTCPNHLVNHQRRALRLKSMKYFLVQGGLGWKNPNGLVLRCVDNNEAKDLMTYLHKGLCGGHHVAPITTHKMPREGYS